MSHLIAGTVGVLRVMRHDDRMACYSHLYKNSDQMVFAVPVPLTILQWPKARLDNLVVVQT